MKIDIILRKIQIWLKIPTACAFCALTVLVLLYGGEILQTLVNISSAVSAYETIIELCIQYLELRKKTKSGRAISHHELNCCEKCRGVLNNYICCPEDRIDIV